MSTRERVSPPSTRSTASGPAEVHRRGPSQQGHLGGQALEGGPDHVGRFGGRADPLDAGQGIGSPPRGAQAAERRHHRHIRRCRAPKPATASRSSARAKNPQRASQATAAPACVDLAVDAVGGIRPELPGHRDGQTGRRGERPRAGVGQQEGARPVGALRLSGLEAVLADQRRLLVDAQSPQRQATGRTRRCGRSPRRSRRRSGRSAASSPNAAQASSDQARRSRSSSSVRDAVVTSVT